MRLAVHAGIAANMLIICDNWREYRVMDSYEWILYAGIAVWLGLGLYLSLLARRQALLARRIRQMALLMEDEA